MGLRHPEFAVVFLKMQCLFPSPPPSPFDF
eukprot:SAG11_NODE_11614_length_749_cov_0.792308_2_plen_29_part_01